MKDYSQFHDGKLDGILINDGSVNIFISNSEKQPFVFVADGVVALSAEGFRSGNIIFDVLEKNSDEITPDDIIESYSLSNDSNDERLCQQLLSEAHLQNLVILQINPSFGATCILLARSINLRPRHG